MALCSFKVVLLTIVAGIVFIKQTEAGIVGTIVDGIESLIKLELKYFTSVIRELFHPPENRNSSIQYLLYTPAAPNETCYLEPNQEALERCPFDAKHPLKFLIHGFTIELSNTSLFWKIKDRMLELYDYNVIVVDWTRYNQPPYFLASLNSILVGKQIAKLIHFLQDNTGVEAEDIHLIGHSLGAHTAGAAGRQVSNLSRITGLDPASPFFYQLPWLPGLTYKDANFVDVMHTSNITSGFGIVIAIGDMDFFPNGGTHQPQCQTVGVNYTGPPSVYTGSCNHDSALDYFLESINTTGCTFLSTKCDNYSDFMKGLCSNDSAPMAEMGLPARPIEGLAPKSKFYLITNVHKPYCKKDGYEPH